MNEEIRFIDQFSGVGGFRLGLEKSNASNKSTRRNHNQGNRSKRDTNRIKGQTSTLHYRCVWSCDNNKYANQVYIKQFGEEGHFSGDIRRVNPEDIPDFDLLCAGFPCQAFSIAGPRKGFQDTRGTLFFEILRIAEAKRPSLLLLENVKGLLNHDGGRTFTVILQSLDELGYWLEWQVLNSKYFGVPQNRERVFIVGHLRGTGGREIFPVKEPSELIDVGISEKQVASTLQSPGHASGNYRGMNMLAIPVLTPERQKKRQQGRRFKEEGAPAFTLTGQDKHGVIVSNTVDTTGWLRQMGRHEIGKHGLTDYRIRRLTPIECERLQGFPDGWTEGISDTQRYKCLGNAVTVNVIEFLGELIKSSFTNKEDSEK